LAAAAVAAEEAAAQTTSEHRVKTVWSSSDIRRLEIDMFGNPMNEFAKLRHQMPLQVLVMLILSFVVTIKTYGQQLFSTGGDTVYVSIVDGQAYVVHKFTTVGPHTFATTIPTEVEYLVVGGGGGGGYAKAAGGGGGGVFTNVGQSLLSLQAGSYPVQVGDLGLGEKGSRSIKGRNGSPSSFITNTALGGGGGGSWGNGVGADGGSGGGGTGWQLGGAGTAGQGNAGGRSECTGSNPNHPNAGGGGGAAGPGMSGCTAGHGGDGLFSEISGTAAYYGAGGGRGGKSNEGVAPGNGGSNDTGGRGGISLDGFNAVPFTGSGGGGGGYGAGDGKGGDGSSGIVIIRYAYPYMQLEFLTDAQNRTVTLPLRGTTDVTIDWGDGSGPQTVQSAGDVTRTYANAGSYTVTISGTLQQFGNGDAGYSNAGRLVRVLSFGNLGLTSLSGAFRNATNLVSAPTYLPQSITDLSYAFKGATGFNQDISGWNTTAVTDMSFLFQGAIAFDQDLSAWDIGIVTNLTSMFEGVTLSTENYSNLLQSWAAQTVQTNLNFHGGGSQYFTGPAETSRQSLKNTKNWTITDGGKNRSTFGTGGDSVYITEVDGQKYVVHKFVTVGSHTLELFEPRNVEYLVVGGGGGGGSTMAGGGGGGALFTNEGGPLKTLTAGNYSITVGNFGAGASNRQAGSDGSSSSFDNITGSGGGGGAGWNTVTGRNGGSGGGGSQGGAGGTGISGQGNSGGLSNTPAGYARGGGGGGAGSAGFSGIQGSHGGDGLNSWFSGEPVGYAAGGGGGMHNSGSNVRSNGGSSNTGGRGGLGDDGGHAVAATGSGGGGGGYSPDGMGGNGSSGIVIIRYAYPDMELVYQTSAPNQAITLPLRGATDATIEWGDGTSSVVTVGQDLSHTYASAGVYTVSIFGSITQFGAGVTGYPNADKLIKVKSFGDVGLTSLSGAFRNATNLHTVASILPATVTDLSYAFQGATGFNQDISGWNTTALTDMSFLFQGAIAFDQDLSTWNIENVTDLTGMFAGVTLSTETYSALLVAWSAKNVNPNLVFDGGLSKYLRGLAQAARKKLTDPTGSGGFGWTITDGGFDDFTLFLGGSSVTDVIENGTRYKVHTFTDPGNATFEALVDLNIEYLLVAGGGGGGSDMGGGGGAGGVLQGNLFLPKDLHSISVGAGGAGAGGYANTPPPGAYGGNTSAFGLTAIGGGGGSAGHRTDAPYAGPPPTTGGSGGGSAARYIYGSDGQSFGAAGTPGQGTRGGNSPTTNTDYYAGGGGGAGSNSEVDAVNGTRSGNGGNGILSSILGPSYYFGGGGGGAGHTGGPSGNGGLGGGGGGSRWNTGVTGAGGSGGLNSGTSGGLSYSKGGNGGANTGGGGGGGSHQGPGGDGSSGIVIIRYVYPYMQLEFLTDAQNRTVTLPLRGTTDVTIDWGDGSGPQTVQTEGDVTHTYADAGSYTVTISGTLQQFGNGDAGYPHVDRLVRVLSFGNLGLTSLSGAFRNAVNLVSVPNLPPVAITNLSHAFQGATGFNQDLSAWDIVNVTNLTSMFEGVTLSTENYSNLLQAWGAQIVNPNLNFHAGNSRYQLGLPVAARLTLTSAPNNWTIIDGGPNILDVSSGGDSVYVSTVDGITYKVHKFTTVGSHTFTTNIPLTLEYLVVGGGGGGGYTYGGGGGAGGLLTNVGQSTLSLTTGTYDIMVGNFGVGENISRSVAGRNGSPSTFHTITALGGGGGGSWNNGLGASGGSGGGGSQNVGGSGTQGQGNNGGRSECAGGNPGHATPGSGGGAGGPGMSGCTPGHGGDGLLLSISGSPVFYAAGGGRGGSVGEGVAPGDGGSNNTGGKGGVSSSIDGSNAVPSTGSGGGGGGYNPGDGRGGNGSSGIVIIRYIASTMELEYQITAAGQSIALPLRGNVDVFIDWGDGSSAITVVNVNQTDNITHTYASAGTYQVSILGRASQFGAGADIYPYADKLIRVLGFGNLGLTSLSGAFRNAVNLLQVPTFLPATVTNLSHAFQGATAFDQDISGWNTAAVTNMSSLFQGAVAFNQPIDGWNVSAVTNFDSMFEGATLFNQPIGGWNVSSATTMRAMLRNLPNFNQDISDWNVDSVTDMSNMLEGSTLTVARYNSLLIKWSERDGLKDSVPFHGGLSKFTLGAALESRKILTNPLDLNWSITDGGLVSPDQTIWYVDDVIILNQSFAAGVEFRYQGAIYPMIGSLDVSASGTGTLSGTQTASIFGGRAVFSNLLMDALVDFTLQGTVAYTDINGNPAIFNSGVSDQIQVSSNYLGGEGRGDDTEVAKNQGLVPIFVWKGGSAGNGRDWFTFANWKGADNQLSVPPDGSADQVITIPGDTAQQPVIGSAAPQPVLDIRGTLTLKEQATLTVEVGPVFQISNGATVTTEGTGSNQGRIVLQSGARYVNLSSSAPTLEVRRQLTAPRGWRMIASPVATSYADFLGELQTQGFPQANLPEANPGNPTTYTPNLLWWDESDAGTTLQGWRTFSGTTPLASIPVPAGRGHFYFNFNGAGRTDSIGKSYTDNLPLTMAVTGTEPNLSEDPFTFSGLNFTARNPSSQSGSTYIDRIEADEGWNLVGNPTPSALNWAASSGWTRTNLSSSIYGWDPLTKDYLVSNGTGTPSLPNHRIAPYQAFWVQATAASPVLSFTNAVKDAGAATFIRKEAVGDSVTTPHAVHLTLIGAGMRTNAWVTLSEQGHPALDRFDAFRLQPKSDTWISAASSMDPGGPSLVINSLSTDLRKNLVLPFYVGAAVDERPYEGDFEMNWELTEGWPEHLNVYLMDHLQKELMDLRTVQNLAFSHLTETQVMPDTLGVAGMRGKSADSTHTPSVVFGLPRTIAFQSTEIRAKSPGLTGQGTTPQALPRFTIVIGPERVDSYLPLEVELTQNYPNPFNPSTSIRFALPEAMSVRVEVYDVLGRLVTTLASGRFEAGTHTVSWDAGRLSSGVYLYRLVTPEKAIVKKMTLIK
jgi:surface protein